MHQQDHFHTKICGITNRDDAQVAHKAGATMLGFIFYEASTSTITPNKAREIVAQLPSPKPHIVGVVVSMPHEELQTLIKTIPLDAVQLHGELYTPEYCKQIDTQIIRAIAIPPFPTPAFVQELRKTLQIWQDNIPNIIFLFDTYMKGLEGGTGKTFDWSSIASLATQFPILLSGGLHPDNVAQAIKVVSPLGVDVKSGVEISPGLKDPDKIRLFLHNIHQ